LGSDPMCAFRTGRFSTENWQCDTMNELRKRLATQTGSEYGQAWAGDQNCGVLKHPRADTEFNGTFLVLCWYKRRGRTEACVLIDGVTVVTDPTIDQVEAFLEEVVDNH